MSTVQKPNPVVLSKGEVEKLAYLARLELTEQEIEEIRPQLGKILEFIKTLSVLDTEGVDPMTTALDMDNRWRPDVVAESLTATQALANSPASDGECFLVPPVLGSSSPKT